MYPICAIVYWLVDLGDNTAGFISEIVGTGEPFLYSVDSVPFLFHNESIFHIY